MSYNHTHIYMSRCFCLLCKPSIIKNARIDLPRFSSSNLSLRFCLFSNLLRLTLSSPEVTDSKPDEISPFELLSVSFFFDPLSSSSSSSESESAVYSV